MDKNDEKWQAFAAKWSPWLVCAQLSVGVGQFIIAIAAALFIYRQQPPKSSNDGPKPLRFAQITDAHLFDAGYKCSGEYVEKESTTNREALKWSIKEISRRWNDGEHVDFVVFTGDLGIVNLKIDVNDKIDNKPTNLGGSNCKTDADESNRDTWGPVNPQPFKEEQEWMAKELAKLPNAISVYFVPGNNDIDEDPDQMVRYEKFLAGLNVATKGRAIDLNNISIDVNEYTLVGLNTAGFKPQDEYGGISGASKILKEEEWVTAGIDRSRTDPDMLYCDELPDNNPRIGTRALEKQKAVEKFSYLVGRQRKYLLFTHEPDIQDDYEKRKFKKDPNGANSCEYRSTWLLTKAARRLWQDVGLNNPNVVGIFAGHFHSANIARYGGPQFNEEVRRIIAKRIYFAPTFITPPLAIKLQWPNVPNTARGMSFVTVQDGIVGQRIVWYPF